MVLNTRQKSLLELLNQMTQNLSNNNGQGVDLPDLDIDVDFDLSIGDEEGNGNGGTPPTSPTVPTTLREVLLELVNEQVEVTTPFGTVAGTLLAVRSDYVVIIDSTGDQVLVRIEKIEFVSEL
ncbi:DUF2642 domain-containing protein [Radiobacillus kanasensis]|uniref:DUF2642 domain-containing protein n=1 Tax=Radiobacillus kanasensis TaxID=2844358 RepID=UPI001E5DEC91|nr:DUF2642 domain-containing protein [Radiobacillus kanasensis]UFU00032.1 DUF2642 domain-containing protein [Radiobacillus kanasensis]